MKMTQWVVITGPPSSGKTTLVNALKAKGHIVSSEVAREIIQYTLSPGHFKKCMPRDSLALQREILAVTLKREHSLSLDQEIFFDRGVPDSIAYFEFHGFNPEDAIRSSQFRHYKRIYYCEGLPVEKDGLRLENDSIAQEIGELIIKAYSSLNYEIIFLPVVSVEERMALVLKDLKK
ncbi:MAG: ATPase [Gammaproteobacteria bacterium]|nr:ATPase [Gammaproteobacteria bacterium]